MGKVLSKVRNQMCEVNKRGKYTAEPFLSQSFYTFSTVISGLKCSERKANCSNFHASFGGIHADSQTLRLSFKVFYLSFLRNNPDLRLSSDTWKQYTKSQEKVIKCIFSPDTDPPTKSFPSPDWKRQALSHVPVDEVGQGLNQFLSQSWF